MAKRKLYGAAKAAHERKLARQKRSRTRRRKPVARKRRRRSRRRSGSYGKRRLRVAGMGAVYGYAKSQTGLMESVPYVESLGRDATAAIALHFGAKHFKSKWLDDMATAIAGHVGVNFGRAGFNLEEFASLQGDDDEGGGISGVLPG